VPRAQATERRVRLDQREDLGLTADGDTRRDREEVPGVFTRQVRDGSDHALLPQVAVREARDVRHVDARADDRPALSDRAQRPGHERTVGREEDRALERDGRRIERAPGPDAAEGAREGLGLDVARTGEREDLAALEEGDLGDQMGRGAEPVEPDPRRGACHAEGAVTDQPRA
jgi:hypothetical protein